MTEQLREVISQREDEISRLARQLENGKHALVAFAANAKRESDAAPGDEGLAHAEHIALMALAEFLRGRDDLVPVSTESCRTTAYRLVCGWLS